MNQKLKDGHRDKYMHMHVRSANGKKSIDRETVLNRQTDKQTRIHRDGQIDG